MRKMEENRIKESSVRNAVITLRRLNKKYHRQDDTKMSLFDNEKALFLQIMLKKVQKRKSIKMIKVHLPHPLIKETNDVCLITGDLDKRNHKAEIEPDVLHYKDLLSKHEITQITEVMTLRQLRTEYKPYEAKQQLVAAYDIFLADNRIFGCLPKILGKHFMKKRKFPIQINMKTVNLKDQINKALSTKVVYLTGHGNCCSSEVAYLGMEDTEIFENVDVMVKVLEEQLPGSWDNVMGVYLKLAKSNSIPLYISYDNPNDVHLEAEKDENDFEVDDLSSVPDGVKVKVFSDGTVKIIRANNDLEDKVKSAVESPVSDVLLQSSDAENEEAEKNKPEDSETLNESVAGIRESKRLRRQTKTCSNSDMEETVTKFIEDCDVLDLPKEETKKLKKEKMKNHAKIIPEGLVTNFIEDTEVLEVSNGESKKLKREKRKSQAVVTDPDDCYSSRTPVTMKNVKSMDSNKDRPVIEIVEDFDGFDLRSIESKKSRKSKRKSLAGISVPDISCSRTSGMMKNTKDENSNVEISAAKFVEGIRKRRSLRSCINK